MSSIKRDVEKNSASTGVEDYIQPTVNLSAPDRSGFCSERFVLAVALCPAATMPIESKRLCKRDLSGNHGSIRGSRPIAISDYPRGHSV